MKPPGQYIYQGKLDNTIHDFTNKQIEEQARINREEIQENQRVTASSYAGENYYGQYDFHVALNREYLYRDKKTDGMRVQYPHGVIIQQAMRRHYYRGENRIYTESCPALYRTVKGYPDIESRELYRMVADMRIAEFSKMLQEFQHVQNWDISDVLYEALAQHYGLETNWLDITSDFMVALFFATCYWDSGENKWKPLTKTQTEQSDETRYGMIFHMPSWYMAQRWTFEIGKFADLSKGITKNLIYPLGFQPFMRCSMQNGYGIYMRTGEALQKDIGFEKLRFRHNEELSKRVFDYMKGGELIYPHEGLKGVDFIIEQLKRLTDFSESAFEYALRRSQYFSMKDKDTCRRKLEAFEVDNKRIRILKDSAWSMGRNRRKVVDDLYTNFSVENIYGIRIMERKASSSVGSAAGASMYEPYMLTEDITLPGVTDFMPRKMTGCSNMWIITHMQMLQTLMTKNAGDF